MYIYVPFHYHVKYTSVTRLPEHVSLDEGALLEPLAVAVYSCQRGDVTPGCRVLVCGAGDVLIMYLCSAEVVNGYVCNISAPKLCLNNE